MKREVAGVILAAGFASRMGCCKPLLPVPRLCALETAVSRMREGGVGKIIVVTGHYGERVSREALRLGCEPVHNEDYAAGMFGSVTVGVRALPPSYGACFLLPVDTPLVKPYTYKVLMEIFDGGGYDAVHPAFAGKRAHPPLIGRNMFAPLLSWSGEGGLGGFLKNFPHNCREIPVADRGTALDMDTPEDYERLMAYAAREFYPDPGECDELLRIAGTPERVVLHGRAVAERASRVADALAEHGLKIDKNLLVSSCLLHDIAKGERGHEARGASWLRERGYGRVASVVASHKDLPERDIVAEEEILYLADKITDGTAFSTLEARMARMESRWPPGSDAIIGAARRIAKAGAVWKKVESITGSALGEIIGGETESGRL